MGEMTAMAIDRPIVTVIFMLCTGWLTWVFQLAIRNIYFHPLSRFPGPKLAAASRFWHAFVECFLNRSWQDVLEDLHAQYGEIVRTGPNELHFSNPQAYHEIYNNRNRWNKEKHLYHSFGEDRSSFGFLTYEESKVRKDVLSKRFAPRAVQDAEGLVRDKVDALCNAFERCAKSGNAADLTWGFRCMSMDVITYLCFGKSVDAIEAPEFKSPIIVAMDASVEVFRRFKHFDWYKNMIMGCPPKISRVISPDTAGLVDLQQILGAQISDLAQEPQHLDLLPHNMTIFHALLDKQSFRDGSVPSAGSLYEESQALMFGGADTTGNTLVVASYFLLSQPETYKSLKQELKAAWPDLNKVPTLRELEKLTYLNAILKESLRISLGIVSGLLRHVPDSGAKICDTAIPGGTIVSCAAKFVHYNTEIFSDPDKFIPERWIKDPSLDNWLVSFSRGPRSCLGINLAWMELRLALASAFRRFDLHADPVNPTKLTIRDAFLPKLFDGKHVKASMTVSKA